MLDRESTFAQPEIVQLLKTKFVPVAIDQAYQRRQKDTEGDFYRKIATQGPRDLGGTTQGFYIATASGKMLLFNNNRHPEKVLRLMKESLGRFVSLPDDQKSPTALPDKKVDSQYSPTPPKGGLVVRVRAKVLSGYEPTDDPWRQIFQSSVSRDNLWISAAEHKQLVAGSVADSLAIRLARFHLVDNTRGEPPFWNEDEIRDISIRIDKEGASAGSIKGSVHLEKKNGQRGYQADILGHIESRGGRVQVLDIVLKGQFWGEGRYTRGAPKGKFPLAITLSLADGSDTADAIPPQGSRGWVRGYIQ